MGLIFAKRDTITVISQYWFQREITNSGNLTCSFCRINRYTSRNDLQRNDSLRLTISAISQLKNVREAYTHLRRTKDANGDNLLYDVQRFKA